VGTGNRVLSQVYVSVKHLFRNKGTFFWVIVFPVLFYWLMASIFTSSHGFSVKVGIYNSDVGGKLGNNTINLGKVLLSQLNSSKVFKVVIYNDKESLIRAVKRGNVNVGMIIPSNFTESVLSMSSPTVSVLTVKTEWSNYTVQALFGFLKSFSGHLKERFVQKVKIYMESLPSEESNIIIKWLEFIKSPIKFEVNAITPPLLATPGGLRAFFAIGIIGIETLFIGLSVGVSSIIDMKRDGTLRVLLASPMRRWEVLLSFTLAALIYVGISASTIFLFSEATGATYNMSLSDALITAFLLFVGALSSIALGLLLAPLARSNEAAMAIVNGVAFPVMFLGGFFIPRSSIPEYLRFFADYYPLSTIIESIRRMLIYDVPLSEVLQRAMPAIVTTVALYAIGVVVFNKLISRAVEE